MRDAQQFTVNFANNNLLGSSNFMREYRTSKARVCVTVGMMTTGYDCTDILNLGLFRPIFSPTDFVQIKGRGTRKHNFLDQMIGHRSTGDDAEPEKTTFKLFDFFGNCQYFENEFNYDETLELPRLRDRGREDGDDPRPVVYADTYEHLGSDFLSTIEQEQVGSEGMRIDRMFFDRFADEVRDNDFIAQAIEAGPMGSRHRLCESGGLRQARGVLHPRQVAPSRCGGSSRNLARDIGEGL